MPNRYSDDTTSLLMRMPKSLKERLNAATKHLNKITPGANYTAAAIARNALQARVEEIEKEMKK